MSVEIEVLLGSSWMCVVRFCAQSISLKLRSGATKKTPDIYLVPSYLFVVIVQSVIETPKLRLLPDVWFDACMYPALRLRSQDTCQFLTYHGSAMMGCNAKYHISRKSTEPYRFRSSILHVAKISKSVQEFHGIMLRMGIIGMQFRHSEHYLMRQNGAHDRSWDWGLGMFVHDWNYQPQ
jgi:hypothetical protein